MNKVAIIIPYFGKWPEWIELFLYSCRQNNEIDFHFFTDCEVQYNTIQYNTIQYNTIQYNTIQYNNLFFYKMTFSEYCEKVSEKIGIQFAPKSAYKLCGLKPFYGFIHSDLLKGYTHWGFCDVDLIFGKISDFVKIENYDVFSTHADRLSGHFCVLRNNDHYTKLCFKIKDWQKKLISDRFYALDEHDFSILVYPISFYCRKFNSKILSKIFNWRDTWVFYYSAIMPFVNLLFSNKKHHFKEMHTTPILSNDNRTFRYDSDRWYYKNGEVINAKTGEPCIYVHFMIYKKNIFRKDYFWKGSFYHITPNDFNDVTIDKSGFSKNNNPMKIAYLLGS